MLLHPLMTLTDALSYFFFTLSAISFAWALTRLPGLIRTMIRTRKDAKVFHEIRRVARRRREPFEIVLMQFLAEHGNEPITVDAVKRWAVRTSS